MDLYRVKLAYVIQFQTKTVRQATSETSFLQRTQQCLLLLRKVRWKFCLQRLDLLEFISGDNRPGRLDQLFCSSYSLTRHNSPPTCPRRASRSSANRHTK